MQKVQKAKKGAAETDPEHPEYRHNYKFAGGWSSLVPKITIPAAPPTELHVLHGCMSCGRMYLVTNLEDHRCHRCKN